jgi:hypothetical protein
MDAVISDPDLFNYVVGIGFVWFIFAEWRYLLAWVVSSFLLISTSYPITITGLGILFMAVYMFHVALSLFSVGAPPTIFRGDK